MQHFDNYSSAQSSASPGFKRLTRSSQKKESMALSQLKMLSDQIAEYNAPTNFWGTDTLDRIDESSSPQMRSNSHQRTKNTRNTLSEMSIALSKLQSGRRDTSENNVIIRKKSSLTTGVTTPTPTNSQQNSQKFQSNPNQQKQQVRTSLNMLPASSKTPRPRSPPWKSQRNNQSNNNSMNYNGCTTDLQLQSHFDPADTTITALKRLRDHLDESPIRSHDPQSSYFVPTVIDRTPNLIPLLPTNTLALAGPSTIVIGDLLQLPNADERSQSQHVNSNFSNSTKHANSRLSLQSKPSARFRSSSLQQQQQQQLTSSGNTCIIVGSGAPAITSRHLTHHSQQHYHNPSTTPTPINQQQQQSYQITTHGNTSSDLIIPFSNLVSNNTANTTSTTSTSQTQQTQPSLQSHSHSRSNHIQSNTTTTNPAINMQIKYPVSGYNLAGLHPQYISSNSNNSNNSSGTIGYFDRNLLTHLAQKKQQYQQQQQQQQSQQAALSKPLLTHGSMQAVNTNPDSRQPLDTNDPAFILSTCGGNGCGSSATPRTPSGSMNQMVSFQSRVIKLKSKDQNASAQIPPTGGENKLMSKMIRGASVKQVDDSVVMVVQPSNSFVGPISNTTNTTSINRTNNNNNNNNITQQQQQLPMNKGNNAKQRSLPFMTESQLAVIEASAATSNSTRIRDRSSQPPALLPITNRNRSSHPNVAKHQVALVVPPSNPLVIIQQQQSYKLTNITSNTEADNGENIGQERVVGVISATTAEFEMQSDEDEIYNFEVKGNNRLKKKNSFSGCAADAAAVGIYATSSTPAVAARKFSFPSIEDQLDLALIHQQKVKQLSTKQHLPTNVSGSSSRSACDQDEATTLHSSNTDCSSSSGQNAHNKENLPFNNLKRESVQKNSNRNSQMKKQNSRSNNPLSKSVSHEQDNFICRADDNNVLVIEGKNTKSTTPIIDILSNRIMSSSQQQVQQYAQLLQQKQQFSQNVLTSQENTKDLSAIVLKERSNQDNFSNNIQVKCGNNMSMNVTPIVKQKSNKFPLSISIESLVSSSNPSNSNNNNNPRDPQAIGISSTSSKNQNSSKFPRISLPKQSPISQQQTNQQRKLIA